MNISQAINIVSVGIEKDMMKEQMKKQERIYLLFVVGICYLLGLIGLFLPGKETNIAFSILQKGFTFLPVIGAFLTRGVTGEKERFQLSLKVWKNWKLWLFCAIVPGLLIGIGAACYFMIFSGTYSGIFYYGNLMKMAGLTNTGESVIANPIRFWLVVTLIGAVLIPLQLLELGEEIGWRGYILPKQIKLYGVRKGVLINGFWWGLAHLPLIYFGFNYSLENPLAPWSNMLLMMLVCFVLGTILSYVTMISGNCMYAAIIHGVINFSGELPVFLTASGKSGLLGPNPTGVIGMSGLIILAIILFTLMKKDGIINKLVLK